MPDLKVSKRPPDSSPSKSGENLRVLINVDSVIVIDEPVVDRLAKDSPNDDHQKDADSHYGKLIVAAWATPGDFLRTLSSNESLVIANGVTYLQSPRQRKLRVLWLSGEGFKIFNSQLSTTNSQRTKHPLVQRMRETLGRSFVHAQVERRLDEFQFHQPVAVLEGCPS